MRVGTIAQTVLVMLLWALCFPLITLGIRHAPHLSFATLRALLAGLTLILLGFALRRPFPNGLRAWLTLAGIGVGATSLGFLGMFHAAAFVSPGIATVIASSQPLLAAVLAGVVLHERLTAAGRIGLLLGFAGIVVITLPQLVSGGERTYFLGVAYIGLAALGVTISNVLLKCLEEEVDLLMGMGIQILIGSVPLGVIAWVTERPSTIHWSMEFIVVLATLSVLGTALVYTLWLSVLRKAPLNRANAFSFLIPVFGLAIGTLFYGERLGWVHAAGILLTLFGVGIVTRRGTAMPAGNQPC